MKVITYFTQNIFFGLSQFLHGIDDLFIWAQNQLLKHLNQMPYLVSILRRSKKYTEDLDNKITLTESVSMAI